MQNYPVLRYHFSDKFFHSANAILWLLLMGTAFWASGLRHQNPDFTQAADPAIHWHILLGFAFILNLLFYVVFARRRCLKMLKECLHWDSNSWAWFKNLGGYPRRFFKIPFGPLEVAPQGRYNSGQKITYFFFFFSIVALSVTGIALLALHGSENSLLLEKMVTTHVGLAFLTTLLVLLAHIPMALASGEYLGAIWRIGPGTISLNTALVHSPLWVEKDLVKGMIRKRLVWLERP